MKSYKFWLLVSCFAIVDMAYVGRLPAKQLNSKRIENSLKIYLLPLVSKCKVFFFLNKKGTVSLSFQPSYIMTYEY